MAASVKIEFDDGSRVISQTLEDAAGVADAGGNAVVLGDKRPASCSMDDYYEITKTTAFIVDGNFQRVALQFPDPLLREAPEVVWTLQSRVRKLQAEIGGRHEGGEGEGVGRGQGESAGRKEPLIFVTGDTSYGSCCVDEVSAQHLKADAIVHYGRACLSPTNSSVPVLYVFGRGSLDVKDLASALLSGPLSPGPRVRSGNASQGEAAAAAAAAMAAETGHPPPPVLLLYDVTYTHAVRDLLELLGDDVTRDGRLVVGLPTPQAYSPLGRNRPSGKSGEGEGYGCGAVSAPPPPPQQHQQQLVALSGEGTPDVGGRGQTGGCVPGVGSAGRGVSAGGRGCCSRESESEIRRGGQGLEQPSSGAACVDGGAFGCSGGDGGGVGGEGVGKGASTGTETSDVTAPVGSETHLDDDASSVRKPCSVGKHALGGGSEKVGLTAAAAAVAAGGSGGSAVVSELPATVSAKRRVRIGGLDVELDSEEALKRHALVFVGGEGRQLSNILLRCAGCVDRVRYDPSLPAGARVVQDTGKGNKDLMRRYYLVQRAKEAGVIGIVVGTLGVQRYSSVVRSLRRMIEDAGRKAYTLAVGKVNVAKLANFAEVDVFCLVACAENSLLNSREFHAPVVTPLELEVALGKREWDGFYSTDFDDVLALQNAPAPPSLPPPTDPDAGTGTSTAAHVNGVANGVAMETLSLGCVKEDETTAAEDETVDDKPFFSLVTGTYTNNPGVSRRKGGIGIPGDAGGATGGAGGEGALVAIGDRSLVEWSSPAADFLGKREFKGLEAMVGQTEVKAATEGQSGIASDYGGV